MKLKLLIGFIASTTVIPLWVKADTYLGQYICHSEEVLRQNGDLGAKVNSRLELRLKQGDDGLVSLIQGIGHVITNYDADDNLLDDEYAYYGLFNTHSLQENPDYSPRVYLEHHQFKAFNASVTNNNDGGGMWGNLVIPKQLNTVIEVHYIFQAGDHMGGTIDYQCTRA
ncbi:hypothetical protein [uncultured Shewanella sp.]|uniref:hypothetical protein n=1 Tax=uncultured Shewanella sp. TaxID=173975 RepID=UPI0026307E55|nr:hypothetical protein [uncultured Shewanella sp.]